MLHSFSLQHERHTNIILSFFSDNEVKEVNSHSLGNRKICNFYDYNKIFNPYFCIEKFERFQEIKHQDSQLKL